MEKKILEDYWLLEQKIASLERRLAELRQQSAQYEHGIARGSNPDFPYQPMTFHVSGYNIRDDSKRRERIVKLEIQLTKQKAEAERCRLDIQEWIAGIEDTTVQLIFTYKYVDGLNHRQIGGRLHMDHSTVGRKIENYLKLHQMHQNT